MGVLNRPELVITTSSLDGTNKPEVSCWENHSLSHRGFLVIMSAPTLWTATHF